VFAIPKSRYDYVAYLNPGPVTTYLFSVTMYTGKKPAGKSELKIYKDVIKSLEFIPQDAAAPPR
jgi:ethanolamine utilization microcompartment shell protein EutL